MSTDALWKLSAVLLLGLLGFAAWRFGSARMSQVTRIIGGGFAFGLLGLVASIAGIYLSLGGAPCPTTADCSSVAFRGFASQVLFYGGLALLAVGLGLVVTGGLLTVMRAANPNPELRTMEYAAVAGDLVIAQDNGHEVWRGRFGGAPVVAVTALRGTRDAVALLDYLAGPQVFANLVRVAPDARLVWQASPPETTAPDAWVSLDKAAPLRAHSLSGFSCVLDPATGVILDRRSAT